MSSLVCNCNSHGNIDYGVPILSNSTDFRTSTGIGLKIITPKTQEFYNLKPYTPAEAVERNIETKLDTFKTHNSIVHDRKHQKWNVNGEPSLAPALTKIHYMRTFKETMFQNPVAPRKPGISEYTSEYQMKQLADAATNIHDVVGQSTCTVQSVGDQPRICTETSGVIKHLDPYLTTNNLSYIPFTPNQLEVSNKRIATFYDKSPELHSHLGNRLMKDDSVFQADIKGCIVPRLVYRVPFSGKTSEYSGSYKSPSTGCMANRTFDSGAEFPDSLSAPAMWQTLSAPNMYCTEYCHIGTGWPVRATVHAKNSGPIARSRHRACYQ